MGFLRAIIIIIIIGGIGGLGYWYYGIYSDNKHVDDYGEGAGAVEAAISAAQYAEALSLAAALEENVEMTAEEYYPVVLYRAMANMQLAEAATGEAKAGYLQGAIAAYDEAMTYTEETSDLEKAQMDYNLGVAYFNLALLDEAAGDDVGRAANLTEALGHFQSNADSNLIGNENYQASSLEMIEQIGWMLEQ